MSSGIKVTPLQKCPTLGTRILAKLLSNCASWLVFLLKPCLHRFRKFQATGGAFASQARLGNRIGHFGQILAVLRDRIARDPTWWVPFRLQDVEKQRERRKTKAKKGRNKKEEKTGKHENPHKFVGVFLGHFLLENWGKSDFF